MQDVQRTSDRRHATNSYDVWPPFLFRVCLEDSSTVAIELTPHQVHHTACNVDFQMSCVRQCPVVVLSVQARSLSVILGIHLS